MLPISDGSCRATAGGNSAAKNNTDEPHSSFGSAVLDTRVAGTASNSRATAAVTDTVLTTKDLPSVSRAVNSAGSAGVSQGDADIASTLQPSVAVDSLPPASATESNTVSHALLDNRSSEPCPVEVLIPEFCTAQRILSAA